MPHEAYHGWYEVPAELSGDLRITDIRWNPSGWSYREYPDWDLSSIMADPYGFVADLWSRTSFDVTTKWPGWDVRIQGPGGTYVPTEEGYAQLQAAVVDAYGKTQRRKPANPQGGKPLGPYGTRTWVENPEGDTPPDTPTESGRPEGGLARNSEGPNHGFGAWGSWETEWLE